MGKYYKFKGNIDYTSVEGKKLLDRDINGIVNNEMWLATLQSLNDKHEGIHSVEKFQSNLEIATKAMDFLSLKKHDDKVNERYVSAVKNLINIHLNNSGIFSLANDCLNNLMWSHYASSHKGYCIEYEFKNLSDLELKRKEGNHLKHFNFFEKVKYSNKIAMPSNINYNHSDFIKIITQKTKDWSYEQEFRIIAGLSGAYNHSPSILKSIIFGFDTDEYVMNYIIEKSKHKNLEFFKVKREKPTSVNFIKEKLFV